MRSLRIAGCVLATAAGAACAVPPSEGGDGAAGEASGGTFATGGTSGGGTSGTAPGGLGGGGSSVGGTTGGGASGGGAGVAATGGSAGTGAGMGGTSGTGGASGMARHGFDTGVEAWVVTYTSSGMLVAGGTAPVIDKGTVMLTHTAADGDPTPGALEATIPYATEAQYVGIGVNYATPVNLAGTVTVHVKLVSGLGDPTDLMTNPGGAKIYAKSGMAFCYANGAYNNLTMAGAWMTIQFNPTTPDYVDPACTVPFDPADVRELGVQFDTGGMTTTATTAVLRIDTVAY